MLKRIPREGRGRKEEGIKEERSIELHEKPKKLSGIASKWEKRRFLNIVRMIRKNDNNESNG